MKGNRSSDGATLPGIPFDRSLSVIQAPMTRAPLAETTAPRHSGRGRRWLLLPSIALIGTAGLVVALVLAFSGGGERTAAADAKSNPDESVSLALPGTPTHTPELAATSTPTEAPVETSVLSDTATPAVAIPTSTAAPTVAGPVRVRYEVVAGDSCDLLRQKFGFPAAALDDFATALIRISGRPPATGCNFRQGDIVCIPTPADLEQIDALARDAGCLLGGTPPAGS